MLYLEDYVELIEHLPIDLRDRFSDMREMDLQVQTTVSDLNGKVRELFRACLARKGKVENADEIFAEIRGTYYKALEDADEKVQLANQIYDLVDRHLRKLDQELAKFKMELEADNGGITEVLERRSLELDNHASHSGAGHLHKRRHAVATPVVGMTTAQSANALTLLGTTNGPTEKKLKLEDTPELPTYESESAPPSVYQSQSSSAAASGNDSDVSNSRPPSRNSTAVGGSQVQVSALQLAAANALQATAEMQAGRRTTTVKANFETNKNTELPPKIEMVDEGQPTAVPESINESQTSFTDDLVDDDSCQSHGDGTITSPGPLGSRPSRTKKQTSKAAAWNQERLQAEARRGHARDKEHHTSVSPNDSVVEMVNEGGNSTVEWPCDPNEPRYCICNQVSYGEMVGCDNEKCTIEWFHYGCVGLAEAPKGKWYCPQCTQTMKRRNKNR